jgi:surface antigen
MIRTTLICTVLVLLATSASAQRGAMNPLRQLPLTREDLAMAGEISTRLTEEELVGESEEWSNPASGNSGTVTLLELFEQDGYSCRRVGHLVKIKGNADARQIELQTCLDPSDDTWKLI